MPAEKPRQAIPLPPSSAEIELPLSSTWQAPVAQRGSSHDANSASGRTRIFPSQEAGAMKHPQGPVPAAPPPKPVLKPATPPVQGHSTCPKCGHSQKPAKSCARCGLLFAKWRPEMAKTQYGQLAISLRESLDALWTQAQNSALSDEERQKECENFHEFARQNDALAYAGDIYRRHLQTNAQDTIVSKLRDRLLLTAEQSYLPAKDQLAQSKGELSRRAIIWGIVFAVALTSLSTVFFLNILDK